MFLVWFLLGIFVGAVVGVSCTYAYLDKKFQKTANVFGLVFAWYLRWCCCRCVLYLCVLGQEVSEDS
nr:MAG TPA: Protein of unknown function (DUF3789) [Caudoviricetes sp.]